MLHFIIISSDSMPIIVDSESSEEFEDASDFNNDDDIFTETPINSHLKHLSKLLQRLFLFLSCMLMKKIFVQFPTMWMTKLSVVYSSWRILLNATDISIRCSSREA